MDKWWATHIYHFFTTNYKLLQAKDVISYLKFKLNTFERVRAEFHFEWISVHDEISEIYERKIRKIIMVN